MSENYKLQVEILNDPKITYTAFDFHAHCKNFDYENLKIFTEGIREEEPSFTYFVKSNDKKNKMEPKLQNGNFFSLFFY